MQVEVLTLTSKELNFKDRLLICLVIYSALREKKELIEDFNHEEAIKS